MKNSATTVRPELMRGLDGTFAKGRSGNPAGRPAGSRNQVSGAARDILEGRLEDVAQVLLDKALGGDMGAIRLYLDRVLPAERMRHTIALPSINNAQDARAAMQLVLKAVAEGHISSSEAVDLTKLLERFVGSWEVERTEHALQEIKDDISAN